MVRGCNPRLYRPNKNPHLTQGLQGELHQDYGQRLHKGSTNIQESGTQGHGHRRQRGLFFRRPIIQRCSDNAIQRRLRRSRILIPYELSRHSSHL